MRTPVIRDHLRTPRKPAAGRRGRSALGGLLLTLVVSGTGDCSPLDPTGGEPPEAAGASVATRPARPACRATTSAGLRSVEEVRGAWETVLADPNDRGKLDALKAVLPRYGEFYVVEGDMLMRGPELRDFVFEMASLRRSTERGERTVSAELLGALDQAGFLRCWRTGERTLTYAIDQASFCPRCADCECDAYRTSVRAMERATSEWEAACDDCGIDFVHAASLDLAPSTEGASFVVRSCDLPGYLAYAFFPGDDADRRYLDIDPTALTYQMGLDGVLRHELGHVLGYRHEHLNKASGCTETEPGKWQRLTLYDPKSVMHYPCGRGEGENVRLVLSDLDRTGHRSMYEKCP